ncbi:hypothetical protein Tsp_03515 [Trichinella spiralis]|uniref:hypothetical protein n=1 Tax=Trichinella spiralis TaxID=6334 RepID=UPI0001EFB41F|nr:hypothetical protein Tsp_03515 [Trichinella spiralis]
MNEEEKLHRVGKWLFTHRPLLKVGLYIYICVCVFKADIDRPHQILAALCPRPTSQPASQSVSRLVSKTKQLGAADHPIQPHISSALNSSWTMLFNRSTIVCFSQYLFIQYAPCIHVEYAQTFLTNACCRIFNNSFKKCKSNECAKRIGQLAGWQARRRRKQHHTIQKNSRMYSVHGLVNLFVPALTQLDA